MEYTYQKCEYQGQKNSLIPETKFDFLPQDAKEAAYKSLVRPILEYGSSLWAPHCNGLNDELENVQKRAARLVTRNYSRESGSMTGILEE